MRMRNGILALAMVLVLGMVPAAFAGNIVLTGHDDDYHDTWDGGGGGGGGPAGAAGTQLQAMVNFAMNGSALPLLIFDNSSLTGTLELANTLTGLGYTYTLVDPANPISSSVFDPTLYSAIVVASNNSCGGCDLTDAMVNNIGSHLSDIAAFVTAGGGIVGLAAAQGPAYPYVPNAAGSYGFPPSTGYVQTTDGAALGIPAVNGDPTHNFFYEPGSGTDPAYKVVERLGDPVTGQAETVAIKGASITCTGPSCTISAPEPGSLLLLGSGLVGLLAAGRKRRRS